MNLLQEKTISCPYCGEFIIILVDGSVERQQYIEDCQVCCRPMDIRIVVSTSGKCQVEAWDEND